MVNWKPTRNHVIAVPILVLVDPPSMVRFHMHLRIINSRSPWKITSTQIPRHSFSNMEAQITSNTFCTYTASPKDATTTVFFISGNPGLIGYYHPFLSLLGKYLGKTGDQSGTESSIQVYGCSLGGFEVDHDNTSPSKNAERSRLYDLEDQIVFVHDKLNALMSANASSANDASGLGFSAKRKVILMGHSVGAYIAMEVLRRHREVNPEPEAESESPNGYTVEFDIIGGVMLFPTVKDIAHSPSGRKLTVRLHPWMGLPLPEIDIDMRLILTSIPDSSIFHPSSSSSSELPRPYTHYTPPNPSPKISSQTGHTQSTTPRPRHYDLVLEKSRRRTTSTVRTPTHLPSIPYAEF